MTVTIDQSFITQFSQNINILLQQRESRLRPIFPVEQARGETHAFERLGLLTASEVVGRLETADLQDPNHSRRVAFVKRYGVTTYLDDADKFKLLIDPTSAYSQTIAMAHGRNYDEVILQALLGNAATGKTGTGSQAFSSANVIAHNSTGMTVVKLNNALQLLQSYEVDILSEPIVLIISADGMQDLYNDSSNQMTSFDFVGTNWPIVTGQLTFRGVEFIHSERIPNIDASNFRSIMCTKNACRVAMAQDMEIKAAYRPDLNFAYQISSYMIFGAVRMEENRVIDIRYQ